MRANRDAATGVALLHPKRRALGRTVDAEPVIRDLRGVTPARDGAKVETPRPVARRILRAFDQLVALRRNQAGDAPVRAIAGEVTVAFTEREAAAAVDAPEERVETAWRSDERLLQLTKVDFGF